MPRVCKRSPALLAVLSLSLPVLALHAQEPDAPAARQNDASAATRAPQSLADRTARMKHMPGLLALDWDARTGKLYMEVPLTDASHTRSDEFIYVTGLPWGTGSNDLGLDRGQRGRSSLVRFERTGPKVLLVEPNEMFRTSLTDPDAQRAVERSFARSVMAGFRVEAESADGATVLVDATDFTVRDAHRVTEALSRAGAGAYRLDAARSTVSLDGTKAFPKNTEIAAELTFSSEGGVERAAPSNTPAYGGGAAGGRYVRDVTPDPRAMTVDESQSFIALPAPGFTPRRFSPRAGYFPVTWRDYDTPLGDPLAQQFLERHRLVKKDPNCKQRCEPVTPIQYYIDRGAAEPMRTALVEGARWWDQAFQAAGWAPGTFKADVLPDGADPMDVRYNMIQWVHRYTRGWSYGGAITDPRTGEIVKGNVTLGSLRGRQDYLIAEALLSPYVQGKTYARPEDNPMLQMVLQRIRQLSAHETGHTLGLSHNFAASSYPHDENTTVSVMDYPHPWVTLGKDGVPDLSHAYPVNIGLWDKVAIDFGYREFDRDGKPFEDQAALETILHDSEKRGIIYITDEDSRPLGSAHPHSHLWDNGTDPATELDRVLTVRAAAMQRFGENAIKPGAPQAQLEDTLVPLYLFHRYQTEAAVKEIGGLDYRYSVRGDGQMMPAIVSAADQKHALASVLKTLSPDVLTLPETLLKIMPPRPPGFPRTPESFPTHTGLVFDPVGSAEAAADLTLELLFNVERANRLVQYHARDASEPSLEEVIDAAEKATGAPQTPDTLAMVVKRAVDARVVEWMLALAANPLASAETRDIVRVKLRELQERLRAESSTVPRGTFTTHAGIVDRIDDYFRDPAKFVPARPVEAPPGMPIGEDDEDGH